MIRRNILLLGQMRHICTFLQKLAQICFEIQFFDIRRVLGKKCLIGILKAVSRRNLASREVEDFVNTAFHHRTPDTLSICEKQIFVNF
jgi:hypothetical protein